ncbi:MAG TPA: PEP-CTERM sorting domain-containing protein [Burkholderiales bacterium]|nr:PEP-CTERM sorting domain-containing protein [Burkholderiales bacterium]
MSRMPTERLVACSAAAGLAFTFGATPAGAVPINLVPYSSIVYDGTIGFDDQPIASGFSADVNSVLALDGASFGERFAGQTLGSQTITYTTYFNSMYNTENEDHDTVTGTPGSPLTLVAGAPGQNLILTRVLTSSGYSPDHSLSGAGVPPFGFSVSTGSVAVLFDTDQSEFGFTLTGQGVYTYDAGRYITAAGTFMVDFLRRDGTLIDSEQFQLPNDESVLQFGFRRDGGVADIGGIVLTNLDPAGISYDDFRLTLAPTLVPEPPTALLVALAGSLLALARRRKA